ncbi:MAG: hypothetical protein JWL58_5024 [Streptosporangiaceae bacterium]|nr:hypothetical protein [Streptosporangiaceae bacterium]
MTDILYWGISDQWKPRFELEDKPDDRDGFEAGYAVVRRLRRAVIALMDPSPLPKNKRLTREEAARYLVDADPHVRAEREELLDRTANQILEASLTRLAHLLKDPEHYDGSLGIDATVIATFARGTSTNGPHTSTDPDAGWYVREGDHRDPAISDQAAPAGRQGRPGHPEHNNPGGIRATQKTRRKAKIMFGYDVALAVSRNPHHDPQPGPGGCGDPKVLPALVMGMKLSKPGFDPGRNGIAVLTDIQRRGYPAGYVGADAAYNNSRPEDWQLPLRALGYQPTYGYRSDQLGIQAQAYGANLVEGTWYCPSMPPQLVTATQDLHRPEGDPAAIDAATWRTRVDARAPYALPPKGRPDKEGHQRYSCPHSAGQVHCELKSASMGTRPQLPLVQLTPSPTGPPKICAQTSITVAPEHGAKHWQPLAYGSREWQKIHPRLRNTSEGLHGYAKNDAHEAIERSQGRRMRGIAAQTLLLAFQLAHVNERKIGNWIDTLPGPDGKPRRRARRRETKPLGTWTPKSHLQPAS